jgi:hypothetical protein
LVAHHLAVRKLEPEAIAPELERRLELLNRYANVVDPLEHAGQCIRGAARPYGGVQPS